MSNHKHAVYYAPGKFVSFDTKEEAMQFYAKYRFLKNRDSGFLDKINSKIGGVMSISEEGH